jgi:hypothetical protein
MDFFFACSSADEVDLTLRLRIMEKIDGKIFGKDI